MAGQSTSPQPPSPAPVTAHSVAETSSPSLALTKTVPSSGGVQTLLDKAADEGLMILKSPRVIIQFLCFCFLKKDCQPFQYVYTSYVTLAVGWIF